MIIDIYYDRFIEKNNEGRGWILKTPFTTNGHNKRYAHSLEDIICKIANQYETLKEILPYTMVQATMANKKEYKVDCDAEVDAEAEVDCDACDNSTCADVDADADA